MPWKARSKAMLREEFVKEVLSKKGTKSELCRKYGISRPTGDKWIERFLKGESLDDKSKAPFKTVNKISADMEQQIVAYRTNYPAIGAVKIRRMMLDEGYRDLPSASTFNNVFKRNGLIDKQESMNSTPYQHFEKDEPNDMWQADFKGHFAMGNGERCHPLNIIDDCTRFNLCSDPLPNETFDGILPSMKRIFETYGLPKVFLCDNGNPWGTVQSTGFTKFEIWLMDLGILTIHGRIHHPQTQGKEERYNRSMTRELLKQTTFKDFDDAWKKCAEYRRFYNEKRPHCALNLETPASKYTPSPRKYIENPEAWEYGAEYKLVKVKSTGFFNHRGQGYFLSEAFGGKQIAVRESAKPDCITLVYRNFKIGRINVDKRVYEFKKIYLIEGDPRRKNNT